MPTLTEVIVEQAVEHGRSVKISSQPATVTKAKGQPEKSPALNIEVQEPGGRSHQVILPFAVKKPDDEVLKALVKQCADALDG